MENSNDSDARLIPFLRNLADSIERRQLLPKQLQSIGEFFMTYQFQSQAIRDGDVGSPPSREFNHQELLKFIVMGWYFYSVILDGRTLPSLDDID
jgi:hypothetical protein